MTGVRAGSEAELLNGCMRILTRESVAGLLKLLSPDAIAAMSREAPGAQGISRDTAYRRWPDRGQALVDVAHFLADPDNNGGEGMFAVAIQPFLQERPDVQADIHRRATVDPAAPKENARRSLRMVLGVSFALQLASPSLIANWVLQVAAASSSPIWRGAQPPPDLEAVGRQLLVERAADYTESVRRLTGLLGEAMAGFGRRPRPGFSAETITRLAMSMSEGCLLHLFVDPRLNDPEIDEETRGERLRQAIELAADAIFELLWGLTEPGSLADPRRPFDHGDPAPAEAFDRVVDAAERCYAGESASLVDPGEVAGTVGVGPETVAVLFPEPGDLADSVLRRLVAGIGLDPPEADTVNPATKVSMMLSRLTRAADTHPVLLQVVRDHPPTHPRGADALLDEVVSALSASLGSPLLSCTNPERTAARLIDFALRGSGMWDAVEALLEQVAPDPATPPA